MLLFLRHKAFTKDNSMGMRMRIVNSLLNTFLYTYFFIVHPFVEHLFFIENVILEQKTVFALEEENV